MCTLLIANKVCEGYPLVVAANRDEKYDRPSAPPRVMKSSGNMIYAPVDLKADGTWIGVSERGVLAAITNRSDVPYRPRPTSRGSLVTRALAAPNATAAMQQIMAFTARDYNGFQLFVADLRNAYIIRGDSVGMQLIRVTKGVTVLTERGIGPDNAPRAASALARTRFHDRHNGTTPRSLDHVLSYLDFVNPEASVSVHDPKRKYGTRSSTIIRLSTNRLMFDVWHREGAPHKAAFGDVARVPFAA